MDAGCIQSGILPTQLADQISDLARNRNCSDYGFVEKTMTCIEPFSLVGTITRRVFGS